MVMNKKASTIFIVLMLGILCFVLGLALANPLKEVIIEQTDSTFLNCTTTVDQQTKAVCVSLDMMLPLVTGTIFALAGMLLAGVALR